MVVFTCGHCGESVQKPKVEKHYTTKCRNRNANLSCMDCFKDFFGEDYKSHVKCITEEQRYSGKGFVAKEKKGELKQNTWVEMVQSVLDEQKDAPKNVLRIIEAVSKHTNTPRKKPKFINFVKNICGHKTNPKDVEAAWDLISVKLSALSIAQNKNQNQEKNGNGQLPNSTEENENTDANDQKSDDKTIANDDVKDVAADDIEDVGAVEKIKTKKQKKEEKKRKKYEAELQSASAPPVAVGDVAGDVEEKKLSKKEKKKLNKLDNAECNNVTEDDETKAKNNKRKRIDTVNDAVYVESVTISNLPEDDKTVNNTEKIKPKKQKARKNEADVSVCLHNQNVAKSEEFEETNEKFNWHSTILSVLQKKGNEIQFKRLQKKVLGEFSEATGNIIDDRIADKFIKKLKSLPKVKVDKNRVILEE